MINRCFGTQKLMNKLFFFFFLLMASNAGAQLTTHIEWTTDTKMAAADVVYYNAKNKLQWPDFRGDVPGETGSVAAITMSGFGYMASTKVLGKKGELTVKVYCFFNKNKSWVKPGKTTDYILTHEQHHFDISYIAANIFIDKLQSAELTVSNYNQMLVRIYNDCIEIMNQMQDEYDGQTRNGQNKNEQARWNGFLEGKIEQITR